nr:unnamed protein product [Callosobruchus chinensis]
MDDNARPHRTRAVQQALENGNIARLKWLAMSPDIMNPIEHVWDYVSRATFNRNNPPRSTQELVVTATEDWDSIPQELRDLSGIQRIGGGGARRRRRSRRCDTRDEEEGIRRGGGARRRWDEQEGVAEAERREFQ